MGSPIPLVDSRYCAESECGGECVGVMTTSLPRSHVHSTPSQISLALPHTATVRGTEFEYKPLNLACMRIIILAQQASLPWRYGYSVQL